MFNQQEKEAWLIYEEEQLRSRHVFENMVIDQLFAIKAMLLRIVFMVGASALLLVLLIILELSR